MRLLRARGNCMRFQLPRVEKSQHPSLRILQGSFAPQDKQTCSPTLATKIKNPEIVYFKNLKLISQK